MTLLERKARLGGATWSFRRHGLSFDNGQHVFLRCCTAYRGSSNGSVPRTRWCCRTASSSRSSRRVEQWRGCAATVSRRPCTSPGALRGIATCRSPTGCGSGEALLPLRCAALDDPALDETVRRFPSVPTASTPAIERVWDLICTPTVNLPADAASLTLAATVFKIGLLTDAAASDIGWAKVPLANVHAEPARQQLDDSGRRRRRTLR